ncbi:MAG: hypothetical protein WCK67_01500 [bacterium]
MKLNLNILKKSIACVFLCIYILCGISICYGAEDSKHVGINIYENESCHCKDYSTDKSKCNCIAQEIVHNQCQQLLRNYTLSRLIAGKSQISSFRVSFEEKYNKINWNIYSNKKIYNQLSFLKTVILVI